MAANLVKKMRSWLMFCKGYAFCMMDAALED